MADKKVSTRLVDISQRVEKRRIRRGRIYPYRSSLPSYTIYLRLGDLSKNKRKVFGIKKRRIIKGIVDDSPYKRCKQRTDEWNTYQQESEELLRFLDLAQHHISNAFTRLHFGFLD